MKKNTAQQVGVRLSQKDYLLLLEEVEKQNSNVSEILRQSWSKYQEQKQIGNLLSKLEQRQRQSTFEMLSVLLALKPEEKTQAKEQLNKKGIKW